jgi:hypothetical protein
VNIDGLEIPAMVSETSEPFARIPIDICKFNNDCKAVGDTSDSHSNRIADAWELQYSTNYLSVDEDSEGVSLADVPGDGYGAHDEYRGFMVKNVADGGSAILVRTNPKVYRDVMSFDDQTGFAKYILGRLSQQPTSPLVPLGMEDFTNSINLRWHQIHDDSIRFQLGSSVAPAEPQNANSISQAPRGYAMVGPGW